MAYYNSLLIYTGFRCAPNKLPSTALQATVYPAFGHTALVSLGQLCNATPGYYVTLTPSYVHFSPTTTVPPREIIIGERDHTTNLWHINLSHPQPSDTPTTQIQHDLPYANNACTQSSITNMIKFLHRAACSSVKFTRITVIEVGHFTT